MNPFHLILVLILTISSVRSFCPSGCQCDETGFKVRCLGVGITNVPLLLSPTLKQLYLSYNLITTVTDALDFYEWLENVDLSHNSIVSLGQNNFKQQIDMKELRLGHNNISRIYPHSFSGLVSLRMLDISHNNLKEFPSGVLSESPKLRILLISNNKILTVSPKAFKGLKSLRTLDLCNNYIRRVPGASLQAVSASLETLQMCRNKLRTIEQDDFPTPLLKYLSLEGNSISSIDPISFVLLSGLKKLNFNNNHLKSIPTRAFTSLLNINFLYISRNNISVIKDNAFKGLSRLSHLEISGCPNLNKIYPRALARCINLNTLKMSHNENLKFLPVELFSYLPRLHVLEMRSNSLETVSEAMLPWASLQNLDIRDNPLVCNCSMQWLLDALKSKNSSFVVTDVVCAAPQNLRGTFLSTLPSSQLFCMNQIQIVLAVVILTVALALLVALGILICKERVSMPEWKPGVKKLGR